MYSAPLSIVLFYRDGGSFGHIFLLVWLWIYKVNRCLARYSPRATTTNRPTNRAPKKPAWPGPYQPKMPILGHIWSFWGKKSFFFTSEIISFVTHITENSPRHLVHIVFGRSLDKMCKKWQYLAQNDQKCIFWTFLGQKS